MDGLLLADSMMTRNKFYSNCYGFQNVSQDKKGMALLSQKSYRIFL